MRDLNMNIQKKDLLLLSIVIVFLISLGAVVAYSSDYIYASLGSDASIHGHTANELDEEGNLIMGHTLEEIIIMASLIEGEAHTQEDREIISGILWKRLKLGLPLQVDASFAYVNGKTTKELTTDDLKIDSPFNTYLYKGLPPTPISNPGLESIKAAIHPLATPYLYFLNTLGVQKSCPEAVV